MSNPSEIHRGWNRGVADATHANTGNVLELLMPGSGTGTHSRQVHIAQAGDGCTDWGLAAQAHPMLVLHSTTTPTTDYTTFQHDGTNYLVNVAGGNQAWQVAGTTELILSSTVLDLAGVNLQMQTSGEILDNNANQLITFPAAVACAIENIQVSNAAAGGNANIAAVTSATNAGLELDTAGTGQIVFQLGGVDTLNVHDVSGVSFVAASATIGHPLFLQTEDGGVASSGCNGAAGALLNFLTGDGGAGGDTNNRAGGAGGATTVQTGAGGGATACTTSAGGAGGLLTLQGGAGGVAASSCTGNAGAGGAVSVLAGAGGAITGGTGDPGVGGVITITAGVGSTSNVSCDTSGAGGALTLTAGAGGTVTAGSGASNDAGVGAIATFKGGDGGASTSANGGNGGCAVLQAGSGGVGTGGAAGGVGGVLVLRAAPVVEGGTIGFIRFLNDSTGMFSAGATCEPSATIGTVWSWQGDACAVAPCGSSFLVIVDD